MTPDKSSSEWLEFDGPDRILAVGSLANLGLSIVVVASDSSGTAIGYFASSLVAVALWGRVWLMACLHNDATGREQQQP